jgi:hypothetical protein
MTTDNNSVSYWVGGFGEPERLKQFLESGIWRMGWSSTNPNATAKKCWEWLREIKVGDWFAIKGYGGRNDVKIHRVGIVKAINRERGEVHLTAERIVPVSFSAPTIGGGGNWFLALSPVTSPEAVRAVFGERGGQLEPTQETGSKAKPMFGPKLYQERARKALPVLVAVADSRQKIYYEDLAGILGISNPRTLNFVLGSIGQTLIRLANEWGTVIPPIQCLVVNKTDELPGEGVGFFIEKEKFRQLSKRKRREVVDRIHDEIWKFADWERVLTVLLLDKPMRQTRIRAIAKSHGQGGGYGSPEHNRKVEQAAIAYVKKYLKRRDYRVRSREREKIGYDLEAVKHGHALYVEVKGVSGNVPEFIITQNEFKKAAELEDYWIYAVTRVTTSPKMHRFAGSKLDALFNFYPTAYRVTLR